MIFRFLSWNNAFITIKNELLRISSECGLDVNERVVIILKGNGCCCCDRHHVLGFFLWEVIQAPDCEFYQYWILKNPARFRTMSVIYEKKTILDVQIGSLWQPKTLMNLAKAVIVKHSLPSERLPSTLKVYVRM